MTAYAVQVIVLILALLGAFFKSVKEDDQGKRVHSKLGLPIPTKPGLTVFVFLILSAGFSSYLIWQNKRDADDKNKVEKQVGERLKSQLTETQNALEKARLDNAVNLASAQKRILDDMQLKQKSNLENFSSVLHLQREAERQAIDGFRKALNPLPTQNLELTLQFLSPHGLIKFSPLANANSQPSRQPPGFVGPFGDNRFKIDDPLQSLTATIYVDKNFDHFQRAIDWDFAVSVTIDFSRNVVFKPIGPDQTPTGEDIFYVDTAGAPIKVTTAGGIGSWLELSDSYYRVFARFQLKPVPVGVTNRTSDERASRFLKETQLVGIGFRTQSLAPIDIFRFQPAAIAALQPAVAQFLHGDPALAIFERIPTPESRESSYHTIQTPLLQGLYVYEPAPARPRRSVGRGGENQR